MAFNLKTGTTLALISMLPITSHAVEIGTVDGVELNLTLQINRALMYADNGDDSEVFFVDNDNSSTRYNFNAEGSLDDDIRFGGQFESEYQSNPSNQIEFESKSINAEFLERKLEVWVKSKTWGKLSLGQGDGAANGNMERDLSATNVINWANPALLGGAIRFGDSGPKISSTMSNLDFESRYDRLRYDSPKFGPLQFAISQGTKGNSNISEVGARLEKKLDSGVRLRGAVGYSIEDTSMGDDAGDEKTVGGSIAVLLANGLNATLAIGQSGDDDPDNPDSKFKSLKLGYISGQHALSLLYARAEDRNRDGDISESLGLGYVYKANKWMDAYAGYKVHSLDRKGTDYDNIDVMTSGIRLKF